MKLKLITLKVPLFMFCYCFIANIMVRGMVNSKGRFSLFSYGSAVFRGLNFQSDQPASCKAKRASARGATHSGEGLYCGGQSNRDQDENFRFVKAAAKGGIADIRYL